MNVSMTFKMTQVKLPDIALLGIKWNITMATWQLLKL